MGIAVLVVIFCAHGSVAAWDYATQANWGTTANADCNGSAQSPIDVKRLELTQSLTTKKDLTGSYVNYSSGAKIKNDAGHTQKVMPKTDENFGKTTFNSIEFENVQLHFVHKQKDVAKYLVLTLFYNIGGSDNEFLTKVKYASGSSTADATVDITESFNVWDALSQGITNGEYIHYDGSFTTPPCTEAVTFVLFRDYLMMSKSQWGKYAATITDTISYTSGTGNARTAKSMTGRTVTLQYGTLNASSLIKVGLSMIIAAMFFMN